jgi:beta-glucosidase
MSDLEAKPSTLPAGFFHGYASASYQIEGALTEGGRGQSQWDVLLTGEDTGRDACDSYHKWEDDIKLLQQYGANSYRFSIAWPRIIPKGEYHHIILLLSSWVSIGGRNDPVNPLGIQYYNKLVSWERDLIPLILISQIDGLVAANITPFVTLFHWDLPLELENRYGGFVVSEKDAEELFLDFENYARVCFEAFGDRVKHWITLNEVSLFPNEEARDKLMCLATSLFLADSHVSSKGLWHDNWSMAVSFGRWMGRVQLI